jgi:hypothetical protein
VAPDVVGSTPTSRPNDAVCLPLIGMVNLTLKRVCKDRRFLKAISIRRHEHAFRKAVPQGLNRLRKNGPW